MRCFVAIELPEATRRGLLRVIQEFRPATARWCGLAQLHVTLKFLGNVAEAQLPEVCEIVALASAEVAPFELRFAECSAFPSPDRPRVVYCGLEDSAAGCERWLAAADPRFDAAGFERERRLFTPHVTLGRTRDPRDSASIRDRLNHGQDELQLHVPQAAVAVEHVSLFESRLLPGGAEYTLLQSASLGG